MITEVKHLDFISTSFQMDQTFWGVVSAAVEQSRSNLANLVAQGNSALKSDPEALQTKKKNGH